MGGLRFRRQHPIGPYIVDFFCADAELVVEVDGQSHDGRAGQDRHRENYLKGLGYRVLRVSNDEVLFDLESVLAGILKACGKSDEL